MDNQCWPGPSLTATSSSSAQDPVASELFGKVCLMTEGCPDLTRAIVSALGRLGATVICLHDGSHPTVQQICEEASERGVRCRALRVDAGSAPEVQGAVGEIVLEFASLDVLINFSRSSHEWPFVSLPIFGQKRTVRATRGFNVTQAVLPRMMQSAWGRVIHVVSPLSCTAAWTGAGAVTSPSSTHSSLLRLAREVARQNITVNAVVPGFLRPGPSENFPSSAVEEISSKTAIGRLGRPEEVAAVIAFLASPRASYITGEIISVNGGLPLAELGQIDLPRQEIAELFF